MHIFGPMTRNPQLAVIHLNQSRQLIFFLEQSKDTYSSMQFTITLRRRVTIFAHYVILPYAVALIFGLAMFLTPIQSGYRICFAVASIMIQLCVLLLLSKQIGFRSLDVPRIGTS